MRLIPAATLPVSRWPNGAGRKADILAGDGWMAGFAWLDRDAPFSDLPGIDRTITLVEGPGFTLDIAGRPPLAVLQRLGPARFDGGAATLCRIAGPCRVFNVMTARDRLRHGLQLLGPGGLAPVGEVASLVVMLRGEGTVGGMPLGTLDAMQLDTPAAIAGDAHTLAAAVAIGWRREAAA